MIWLPNALANLRQAVSRRSGLKLAAAATALAATKAAVAAPEVEAASPGFVFDSEADAKVFENIHEGKGSTSVKYFLFSRKGAPAFFLTYDFPPGASEGVHVHRLGDAKLGSFDEFYYIVAGQGHMEIDGKQVAVKAGDHIFTPIDTHHGIENTAKDGNLKVFLTYVKR